MKQFPLQVDYKLIAKRFTVGSAARHHNNWTNKQNYNISLLTWRDRLHHLWALWLACKHIWNEQVRFECGTRIKVERHPRVIYVSTWVRNVCPTENEAIVIRQPASHRHRWYFNGELMKRNSIEARNKVWQKRAKDRIDRLMAASPSTCRDVAIARRINGHSTRKANYQSR